MWQNVPFARTDNRAEHVSTASSGVRSSRSPENSPSRLEAKTFLLRPSGLWTTCRWRSLLPWRIDMRRKKSSLKWEVQAHRELDRLTMRSKGYGQIESKRITRRTMNWDGWLTWGMNERTNEYTDEWRNEGMKELMNRWECCGTTARIWWKSLRQVVDVK